MNIRAIAGLVVLNLFWLAIGMGILWGLRGWRRWTDALRLAGVAYLVGVSSFMIVATLELVVGIPFRLPTIVPTGLGLALAGILVGRRRGFVVPRIQLSRPSLRRVSLLGALFLGAIVVYFEAIFRAGRLTGLGWDVWASWMPKAKSIYYSGGLDAALFGSLPGPSYPPGLPILHAAAFHAMGSADATTLHLEYWFLGIGFAGAVAGLLTPRVRVVILLPLVLLMLTMPDFRNRATDLYGDIPLGFLIAASALLLLLWLDDRRSWKLLAATILLGGAMLTKREGVLFAACVVFAALVASFRERRSVWPRLLAAGAVAFAFSLPWRVWFTASHIPSDAPEGGYLNLFSHLDRVRPSFDLVLGTVFDYQLWLVVPVLGIAAALLAYVAGARLDAVYVLTLFATTVVASAWTFWSNPSLGLSRDEGVVNRVVGTPMLAIAALTPLLLEKAWVGRPDTKRAAESAGIGWTHSIPAWVPWVVVAVVVLSYPSITLAGGVPRFPSVRDCVVAPVPGQKVRVVFGYANTFPDAEALRARVIGVGFRGTEASQDGCGRVRVSLNGVPSISVGEAVVREARAAHVGATLELDPSG